MKNSHNVQFSLKAQIIHITSYDFDTRQGITKIDHADIVKGKNQKWVFLYTEHKKFGDVKQMICQNYSQLLLRCIIESKLKMRAKICSNF